MKRSAYDEGVQAARAWMTLDDYMAPTPKNPTRTTAWDAGYATEIYRAFGDQSADMERAERRAGA